MSNTGEYGCRVFFIYDQSIYGNAARTLNLQQTLGGLHYIGFNPFRGIIYCICFSMSSNSLKLYEHET